MTNKVHPPAVLEDSEWNEIEAAFNGHTSYLKIIGGLRATNNTPHRACDILPDEIVNQGNEYLNVRLHAAGLPFRFSRVESWVAENRRNRKLAIIRLPQSHMDKYKKRARQTQFVLVMGG